MCSIPRRSRHFKKLINVNILTFTDDKLKYYEQIPVQFNALESTQSLPVWDKSESFKRLNLEFVYNSNNFSNIIIR